MDTPISARVKYEGDIKCEFSSIITGILGAEGPVFLRDGSFYMVAPEKERDGKPAGEICKIDLADRTSTAFSAPTVDGFGGIPAGCQSDHDDNLWVADMRLGILKVQDDGTFKQLVKTDSSGAPMQGCNDLAFDYNGNLWITAPAGDIAPSPYSRSSKEAFGSVYCLTTAGEVIKVASGYLFPNGIAVQHLDDNTPDTLIVAETHTKTLWAYKIEGPGKLGPRREWGKLPGDHHGGPDGMDFDAEGNLLVANHGGGHLEVFGPAGGGPWARIKCPFTKPSNLHFRPKSKEVFVTEHDSHGLWSFTWRYSGKEQYCEMPRKS